MAKGYPIVLAWSQVTSWLRKDSATTTRKLVRPIASALRRVDPELPKRLRQR